MAIERHPLTGVALNSIDVRRKALSYDEAVTAILLRHQGMKYHDVAHQLGTNTHRLGEVYRGEIHPGAADDALRLLT